MYNFLMLIPSTSSIKILANIYVIFFIDPFGYNNYYFLNHKEVLIYYYNLHYRILEKVFFFKLNWYLFSRNNRRFRLTLEQKVLSNSITQQFYAHLKRFMIAGKRQNVRCTILSDRILYLLSKSAEGERSERKINCNKTLQWDSQ